MKVRYSRKERLKDSFLHFSNITLKHRKKSSVSAVILGFIATIFVLAQIIMPVSATQMWQQTDWSGGVGPSTTNQYQSATGIAAAGNAITLPKSEKIVNGGMESNIDGWSQAITATGGTTTTEYVGDGTNGISGQTYRVHSFTTAGASTFNVTNAPVGSVVDVLVFGGGGGGGSSGGKGGGGGSATGLVSISPSSTYNIVVGGGGLYIGASGGAGAVVPGGGGQLSAGWGGQGGGLSGIFTSSTTQAGALLIAGGGGGGSWGGSNGGAGGGSTGIAGTTVGSTVGGGGGTQSAGGAGFYSSESGSALQGGRPIGPDGGGGGAGGGGYFGGGAASNGNPDTGGGGGSGYYKPASVTSAILTAGSGSTPGDSTNSLRGTAGNGGSAGAAGVAGSVIIRYPVVSGITYSTSRSYGGSVGSMAVASSPIDLSFIQTVASTVGTQYTFETYIYKDGSAVTSSDAQLSVGGSVISTNYTDMGSGWYKLSASVTVASASSVYGVTIKSGRTVNIDNISLYNYKPAENIIGGDMESGASVESWGSVAINATGGTRTDYIGDGFNGDLGRTYRVHSFKTNGSDTFSVASAPVGAVANVLVVAGGGGGGNAEYGYNAGGGGGGGGLIYNSAYGIATVGSYPVVIGAGGGASTKGINSSFDTIIATGGGKGGTKSVGGDGGSGGGGSGGFSGGAASPAGQGYAGGTSGGGGAGMAGNTLGAGIGGDGLAYSISGSSTFYAGGGGGTGAGGSGGGGAFRTAGTANTGGGGGGGKAMPYDETGGMSGGSGIVIVRYPLYNVVLSTTKSYGGSVGSMLVSSSASNQTFAQTLALNIGSQYVLEAYVYKDGSAVTSSDAQLSVGGSSITTSYTDSGDGWYKLSANITVAATSSAYGVIVKSGSSVNIDNISLHSLNSGNLISNIYDLGYGGDWGVLNYEYTGTGTVNVKVRTSNSEDMTGAADWANCPTIVSGTDLTGVTCINDNHRYLQYQVELLFGSSLTSVPIFTSISIAYSAFDNTPPITNASLITMKKELNGATVDPDEWTNGSSPVFSWADAADNVGGKGIKGYCLYLGKDNSADITQTKGLLGTSPVDTGGVCQYAVSGTEFDIATNPLSEALVSSNSKYYLLIRSIDEMNNLYEGDIASFAFKFDNTPPRNPDFISAPSQFLLTKRATLTWANTGDALSGIYDGNSGLAGLQYRIGSSGNWYGDAHRANDLTDLLANDGSYSTHSATDDSRLVDGNNMFYFRTIDNAGNISSAYVTAILKINTSAPSSPQNLTATPETNTNNEFAFSWLPPATYIGDESMMTYCYTINVLPSASSCSFTAPGQKTLSSGAYATQPQENTIYVVAKDESGSINYSTAASATFTADTAAPGMPLYMDVADISIKATETWKLAVSWESPTDTGAGIKNYKVFRSTRSDGGFEQKGITSGKSYVDSALEPIEYFYYIKACDSANNCGAPSAIVSKLPTGRFTTPANIISDPSVTVSTRKATISWTTDRSSDTKVQYGTESGNYQATEFAISDQVKVHQIEIVGLDAGTTYFFKAKWTDEDGNTGTSPELSFTTMPAPTIKNIEVIKKTLFNATIQFTTTGATKADIYYGKSEGFGGLKTINTSMSESTYAIELSGLDDGTTYYFRVDASDSDGYAYAGNIFTFTTPPSPRISNLRFQPVEGEPTSTQKVTWTTNVPASSTITYGLVGSNGSDIYDSKLTTEHTLTIKNLQDNSNYFLMAQSRDFDGNQAVSDRQVFKTALDTRPPKISEINVETSVRGNGAEATGQIVVSWSTDEPATSQVAFGEGSGTDTLNNKTPEDATLSTEHIVIISDLATSRAYTIQPISNDEAQNVSLGDKKSAIISRASDSVMTLALNTLRKLFGF